MNNVRRKQIRKVIEALHPIYEDVNTLAEQEEESFDSLPESLQESERGEKMQEAAENLYEAVDMLDEAMNALESAAE